MTKIKSGPGKVNTIANPESFLIFNFDIDSDDLKVEHKKFLIDIVIPKLKDGGSLCVVGMTDRTGSVGYNQALSLRRAQKTAAFMKSSTKISFNVAQQTGFGEAVAIADGDLNGSSDEFFRSVQIFVSNKPTPPSPPPAPSPSPPVMVKRVIGRHFLSTASEKAIDTEPGPDLGAIFDAALLILSNNSKAAAEFLASNSEKQRDVALLRADLRVNSVTIETDFSETMQTFAAFTVTTTDITYEWGVPAPSIKITSKTTTNLNDKKLKDVVQTITKPRAEAEQLPFIVPPDP